MDKEQLRSLMKKTQNERKQEKVSSPLTRYNNLGQLTCVVCNSVVSSEAVWAAHCASKKHKESIQKLKEAKALASLKSDTTTKRPRDSTSNDSGNGLPQDFFDSSNSEDSLQKVPKYNQQEVIIKAPSKVNNEDSTLTEIGTNNSLPEGFFENKERDTKVRQELQLKKQAQSKQASVTQQPTPKKTEEIDINQELLKFQEIISEEVEKVEQLEEDREVETFKKEDEIEKKNQEARQHKLEEVKRKQIELKKMREKQLKQREIQQKQASNEEEGVDLDNLFDWRSRAIN